MAIVTQPLGSSEARGSVGGLTYTTWRGKHICKARQPDRPPAAGDALAMLQLAWAADGDWNGIDQPSRDRWNAWAAQQREPHWTGQDKRLTGHNWFVRIYVRQCLLGNIPELIVPNYAITHSLTGLYLALSANELELNWTVLTWPDDADYYIELYLAGPLSPGIHATLHHALRWGAFPYLNAPASLGIYPPGTYTAFPRLMHISGLATPFQSARLTVT